MRRDALEAPRKRTTAAFIGIAFAFAAVAVTFLATLGPAVGASVEGAMRPAPERPDTDIALVAPTPADPAPDLSIALAEPPEFAPLRQTKIITEGELQRGDSLGAAMGRENVPASVVHLVTTRLSPLFNFRHSQPGHRFRLVQDLDGRVLDFRYYLTRVESLNLKLVGDEYVTDREVAKLERRPTRVAGVVTTSLYGALKDLGAETQLANDFSEVFAYDVDFTRTVQPGDEFRLVYERLYLVGDDGTETYIGPGRILAARYGGTVGEHTALYFEADEGRGGYYRPDGSSVQRQFRLAPLRYSRVSSTYQNARRHPILNITRPHHGIDYAAQRGEPVWSVADGKVIYRSWAGGFGNLVKVRHNNGYVSYYAHLSRFTKGMKVGDTVQQRQVIGYVGSTGLATGPHVCFRIAKDGQYVNPAQVQSPQARPIADGARERFAARRDTLLSELDAGAYVETAEAL